MGKNAGAEAGGHVTALTILQEGRACVPDQVQSIAGEEACTERATVGEPSWPPNKHGGTKGRI